MLYIRYTFACEKLLTVVSDKKDVPFTHQMNLQWGRIGLVMNELFGLLWLTLFIVPVILALRFTGPRKNGHSNLFGQVVLLRLASEYLARC